MKLKCLIILFCSLGEVESFAQNIFFEDFESVTHPNLPTQWTTTTLAIDGGFYTGNADSAGVGNFWILKDHTTFAMSNDDVCGSCDKSDDYLILPTIDLSGYVDSTVFLQFDIWMEDFWEGIGMVKIDTGSGWIDIYTMNPIAKWQTRVVNLSSFVGSSNVSIAFHYNDEGTSGLGLAIDDVSVYVPSHQYDAAIYTVSNTYADYTQMPQSQLVPITLNSSVYNNGQDTLYDVKLIAQSSQTGFIDTAIVGVLSPAEYASFSFNNNWIVANQGVVSIDYSIIHSNTDGFNGNNTANNVLIVSDSVMAKELGAIEDAQIPMDGETIAQTFRVYKKDTLTSASIHLLMADPTDMVKFYVYEMVGGFPDNIIDSTQAFTSLTTGWTTHYFSSGIELDTGYYAIGMKKIGTGITGLSASQSHYTPNTTFTSRFFVVDYFWYWDEQAFPGTMADHHTYLMRPNFGGETISVGINNQIKKSSNLTVFPNPSNGVINILTNEKIETLIIYDVAGKIVFQETAISKSQFDFTYLEKGIYFAKIKLSSRWESIKLIIR